MKMKEEMAHIAETSLGPIEYLLREKKSEASKGKILAIHGAMGGYEQSDILARAVGPEGYRYISVSRPGYLRTPLQGRETPEKQADLLAALLDELAVKKVIVLAISGGGYSAIHFALRHAERCMALILCSTVGGINDVPIPFAFNVMKIVARVPFLLNYMRNNFLKNEKKSLERSISHPDILERMIGDEDMMSYYKALTLSTFDRMAERLPGTINDIRVTQNIDYPLEDITVPALIIHGKDDPVVPYDEHGKKLYERIPNAELCLIERGEHMTIFTHNIRVRKSIDEFLAQLH